jgi:hypothetical protein
MELQTTGTYIKVRARSRPPPKSLAHRDLIKATPAKRADDLSVAGTADPTSGHIHRSYQSANVCGRPTPVTRLALTRLLRVVATGPPLI